MERLNVFVGIGLWSKKHGLTQGLPICVLSMLFKANQMRNELGGSGTIYLLIGDSVALESRQEDHPEVTPEEILQRCDEYIQMLTQVCSNLGIHGVEINCSSEVVADPQYQKIMRDSYSELCQRMDVFSLVDALVPTTRNYILRQTSISMYYAQVKACAVKIGWRREEELTAYDEPWFDGYYNLLDLPLSFEYTLPGIGIKEQTHDVKDSVPYCAADPNLTRILFGDDLATLRNKLTYHGRVSVPKKLKILLGQWCEHPTFRDLVSLRVNEPDSKIFEALIKVASLSISHPRQMSLSTKMYQPVRARPATSVEIECSSVTRGSFTSSFKGSQCDSVISESPRGLPKTKSPWRPWGD